MKNCVMSGYYHQDHSAISPYSMGNATSDSDDETYLKMDQFQDKDATSRDSNMCSTLNNILTLHNNERPSMPSRSGHRPSSAYSDWSPRTFNAGFNEINDRPPPKPGVRSVVPNYSMCDPAKRAQRPSAPCPPGNPPVHSRLPPKTLESSAIADDQEAYLTFETPLPEKPVQGYSPLQPPRRLPSPRSAEDPPPRPPRSPAKFPSNYDDHRLPFKLPPMVHDQPPERPPPLPPTHTSPGASLPRYPSPVSRQGSDKSSSSASPASSRPSSTKEPFSHVPNRRNNYSTESSGSTSSEDLTHVTRPLYVGTSDKFVRSRPDRVPNKFPKIPPVHRNNSRGGDLPQLRTSLLKVTQKVNDGCEKVDLRDAYECMDPLDTSRAVEDQAYFKDVDRESAQSAISSVERDGAFLVRPRQDEQRPYALSLWANNKCYNFIIRKKRNGSYALGNRKADELTFSSVPSLIEHYQNHEVVLAENEGSVKLTVSP